MSYDPIGTFAIGESLIGENPPNPLSSIGEFVIGESPIGVAEAYPQTILSDTIENFSFAIDLTMALLWQYNMAENLTNLVEQKNAWYQTNQVAFWTDFISDIFDIRTCNQFGLVVWSIILNIPLHIPVPPPPAQPTFGFGSYNKNFNNGNFTTIAPSVVSLNTDQQRILLLLRYNQLTGNCTVPFINWMLQRILGSFGRIYVEDPLDMSSITYVLTFIPPSGLWFILSQCNVLPRPAGVNIQFNVPA
jgi:hypothetical protein